GSYRGPGDSVPPGTPVLLKSKAGPGSPGPSGPSAGGGNQDGFLAGLPAAVSAPGDVPERAELSEVERKLQDLGYVGGEARDDDARRSQGEAWRRMTAEEQARAIELRGGTIVRDCLPRPNERPRDMFFRFWGDNPFEVTMLDKLSTFSVDVDTASYALARRY